METNVTEPYKTLTERMCNNMLHIDDAGNIKLTRGDTARLTIIISNVTTDDPYEMSESDLLELTVRKSTKDDDLILLQKAVIGLNEIHIKSEDTAKLTYGKYKYDVQLTTANKDVYPVIEPSTFEVMPEVTI